MEQLKAVAREQGLWNLFMTHGSWGAGLSNVEYLPLAGVLGRSIIGPETTNCSAPDTGNMELLQRSSGRTDQQVAICARCSPGDERSCFAMTEPDVASSDATEHRDQTHRPVTVTTTS